MLRSIALAMRLEARGRGSSLQEDANHSCPINRRPSSIFSSVFKRVFDRVQNLFRILEHEGLGTPFVENLYFGAGRSLSVLGRSNNQISLEIPLGRSQEIPVEPRSNNLLAWFPSEGLGRFASGEEQAPRMRLGLVLRDAPLCGAPQHEGRFGVRCQPLKALAFHSLLLSRSHWRC